MRNKQWELIFTKDADKQFQKLNTPIQRQIKKYIIKVLSASEPRDFGKPLAKNLKGYWRYRVGDYRLTCVFENKKLLITVVECTHRSKSYQTTYH